MNGKGVIVMRLNNGTKEFHEHERLQAATVEARRLAGSIGGRFVVYVPVALVEGVEIPTTRLMVREKSVAIPDIPFADPDADLPF